MTQLNEFGAVQSSASIGQAIYWLDAAAAFGDDADTSGWCYGRARRISHGYLAVRVPNAVLPIGKGPSLLRQLLTGAMSHPLNELTDPFCEANRIIAIVADAQNRQRVGKTHDAETYLPVAKAYIPDFRDWPMGGVNHIIQESHGIFNCLTESAPIHVTTIGQHELRNIQRTEIAGLKIE